MKGLFYFLDLYPFNATHAFIGVSPEALNTKGIFKFMFLNEELNVSIPRPERHRSPSFAFRKFAEHSRTTMNGNYTNIFNSKSTSFW